MIIIVNTSSSTTIIIIITTIIVSIAIMSIVITTIISSSISFSSELGLQLVGHMSTGTQARQLRDLRAPDRFCCDSFGMCWG